MTKTKDQEAATIAEQYEAACAEANRQYVAGLDTSAIDSECDRLQALAETAN